MVYMVSLVILVALLSVGEAIATFIMRFAKFFVYLVAATWLAFVMFFNPPSVVWWQQSTWLAIVVVPIVIGVAAIITSSPLLALAAIVDRAGDRLRAKVVNIDSNELDQLKNEISDLKKQLSAQKSEGIATFSQG